MATVQQIIIITGPTGVGKTDFVDRLALKLPIEIVNADMGQLYTPLSIGTAKPDWQSSPTPHHLFDIINDPADFTAVAYRARLIETIQGIWARNRIPVVVGGSLFYIKTLFFVPQESPAVSPEAVSFDSKEYTWAHLNELDPARAATIHKNDSYRIERALAIWYATGIKPSTLTPLFSPVATNITMLFLTRDREDLHDRIKKRIESMMASDWLREAASLQSTGWDTFLKRKKLIGYNELLHYCAQEYPLPEMLDNVVAVIDQRTRAYAKRQHTFWRMLSRQVEEEIAAVQYSSKITIGSANLTSLDIDLYIEQLSDTLIQRLSK